MLRRFPGGRNEIMVENQNGAKDAPSSMQETIFQIIVRIANSPGTFDYGDSVLYGLKNYIARHSLANDTYYVSEKAFSLFDQHKLRLPLMRAKIGNLKTHFTFEHPIPASVVMKHIQSSKRTPREIAAILNVADCVTLITKDEDRQISLRHNSSMPAEWNPGASQFARYELCGISLREEKIPVIGRLVR